MIKIENISAYGWEEAIRGMRNPMNSWDKSDSEFYRDMDYGCSGNCPCERIGECDCCFIGENDLNLMKKLGNAGSDHAKYLRMITVYMDITCHHTWWAEFDTYKVGTVRNSCSKMHKIHIKEFVKDDFSHEGIDSLLEDFPLANETFEKNIETLEKLRVLFNKTQDKRYWRAIIELLPMGYNIKATVQLNYQVLKNMYHARKNHKLDEWHKFCEMIEELPYSELITGENK